MDDRVWSDLVTAWRYQVAAKVIDSWEDVYRWRRENPWAGPYRNDTMPQDTYKVVWDTMEEILPRHSDTISYWEYTEEDRPEDYSDYMLMASQFYIERALYGKWRND